MNEHATIDLRSDTVTTPSIAMREAIASATVGDDVLDGDPTTTRLERRLPELLGHEAALFFPTGTQANQVGIGLLAERGTEVVAESQSHLVNYEQSGAAALWGVQLRTVETPDGALTADRIAPFLRSPSMDYPRTAAVAVENTHNYHGGRVTGIEALRAVRALVDEHGIALLIDGARLWNAAHALNVPPCDLAQLGTCVMVSFSKGLGCPAGACLAGPRELIERGIRLRRRLGGGMRQSGILAAACLYALDHNLERIPEDHANARLLAEALQDHPRVRPVPPDTNIVMLDLIDRDAIQAAQMLGEVGVRLSVYGPARLRAVTHLGVSADAVSHAAETVARVLA